MTFAHASALAAVACAAQKTGSRINNIDTQFNYAAAAAAAAAAVSNLY